jgi:hypothetical protein
MVLQLSTHSVQTQHQCMCPFLVHCVYLWVCFAHIVCDTNDGMQAVSGLACLSVAARLLVILDQPTGALLTLFLHTLSTLLAHAYLLRPCASFFEFHVIYIQPYNITYGFVVPGSFWY